MSHLTDREVFANAMHSARVYHKTALESRQARIFWLRAALECYQTARRARDRMRVAQ